MQTLTINTSKTPSGYSASCDIIPGWVVAYEGDFDGFEPYVRESIDFMLNAVRPMALNILRSRLKKM